MSQLFQAFFQDGRRYGLDLRYSFEDEPLGTAGAIGLLLNQLEDDFLVMNGDLLTTLNYQRLFQFHRDQRAAATIGTFSREVHIDFGVLESDASGRLQNYIEKPNYQFAVSMGINVFRKEAIAPYIAAHEHVDIPTLMLRLHHAGLPVLCYREECHWLDIGRIDDYQTATEAFESRRAEFLPE